MCIEKQKQNNLNANQSERNQSDVPSHYKVRIVIGEAL